MKGDLRTGSSPVSSIPKANFSEQREFAFLFFRVLIFGFVSICIAKVENISNRFSRGNLGTVIKVTVKISRHIEGRMSEPLLNFFHRYTIRKEQTCTRMSQVMETELSEMILLNHCTEMVTHKTWGNQIAELVGTDKLIIVVIVFPTESL